MRFGSLDVVRTLRGALPVLFDLFSYLFVLICLRLFVDSCSCFICRRGPCIVSCIRFHLYLLSARVLLRVVVSLRVLIVFVFLFS